MSNNIVFVRRTDYTPKKAEGKHWSFGKERRFKAIRPQVTSVYSVPDISSKRSCSFGLGKRWELCNKKGLDSPSPESYNIPSLFQALQHRSSITGQEKPPRPPVGPGPGSYDVTRSFNHASRYSGVREMHSARPMNRPRSSFIQRPISPGPGAYDIQGGFGSKKAESSRPVIIYRTK